MDLTDVNNVSVFSPYVGNRFEIEIGEDQFVNAELVEADTIDAAPGNSAEARREPFSLLFAVEGNIELPQQIYQVRHKSLGNIPLFLVPVGPGRMESIFN